jgi:multidrug resistance efflux pump
MGRLSSLLARSAFADGEPKPSPADSLPVAPRALDTSDPDPTSSLAGLDAAGRIAALSEAFRTGPGPEVEAERADKAVARLGKHVWAQHRRLLKTLIGLLVVVAAGWMPVRALLETTSTEAVINARLITLRAPIEGQIGPLGAIAVGIDLQPGVVLVSIANPRAERGRLDDLRRLVDQLEGESKVLIARRHDLEVLHEELAAQARAFQAGRKDQLEARVAELMSELAAADARRAEAETTLARTQALADSGTSSKMALERAKRDAAIAAETQAALGHRLGGVDVELSALRKGVYIGDNYNDRPQSLQRADEIALRLREASADIGHRQARLASLRTELAAEQDRYAERAAATLVAPVRGSIWEIMTAPGETVGRGQDLVRVLDCSGLVVTATVGETAYNQLRIGDAARFRFRGGRNDYQGRIVGLTGVATAPANLAILPSALAKEPYRVTVALPDLAKAERCDVGRTGRVTFDK